MILCIDRSAPNLTVGGEIPLFDGGQPTAFVTKARWSSAASSRVERQRTEEFVKLLTRPRPVRGEAGDLHAAAAGRPDGRDADRWPSTTAFRKPSCPPCPTRKIVELQKNGALAQIYAHLVSLLGWENIVQARAEGPERGGPPTPTSRRRRNTERVRHEKTSRPASSSRSCWAMTMPLSSPTGSLPSTVIRPRSSSPAGGLRAQRRASIASRLVCGHWADASRSAGSRSRRGRRRGAVARYSSRRQQLAECFEALRVDHGHPERDHLSRLKIVE